MLEVENKITGFEKKNSQSSQMFFESWFFEKKNSLRELTEAFSPNFWLSFWKFMGGDQAIRDILFSLVYMCVFPCVSLTPPDQTKNDVDL